MSRRKTLYKFYRSAAFITLISVTSLPATAQSYDELVSGSKASLKAGDLSGAMQSADRAIKTDASRWEAYALAGAVMVNEAQCDSALSYLKNALQRAPEPKRQAIETLIDKCSANGSPVSQPQRTPSQPTSPTQAEIVLWKSIENSRNVLDYQSYLSSYPNGAYAPLAHSRISQLQQEQIHAREVAIASGGNLVNTAWQGNWRQVDKHGQVKKNWNLAIRFLDGGLCEGIHEPPDQCRWSVIGGRITIFVPDKKGEPLLQLSGNIQGNLASGTWWSYYDGQGDWTLNGTATGVSSEYTSTAPNSGSQPSAGVSNCLQGGGSPAFCNSMSGNGQSQNVAQNSSSAAGQAQTSSASSRTDQAPTIRNPTEYSAYVKAIKQQDSYARARDLESFVAQFPNSVVRVNALELLMGAYQQLGNQPKVVEIAQHVLAVDSANLRALALLTFLARQEVSAGGNPNQKLTDLDQYCQRGLEAVKLNQIPAGMQKRDFDQLRNSTSVIFAGGCGFGALQNKDYLRAQQYLKSAVDQQPDDLQNVYPLAIAYISTTPPDMLNALFYLARAVSLAPTGSSGQQQIESYARNIYQNYHGSEEGWDSYALPTAKVATTPPADWPTRISPSKYVASSQTGQAYGTQDAARQVSSRESGHQIEPGNLVYKVDPVYPDAARKAGVSGSVSLKVLIGTDGSVKQVSGLSGDATLAQAAMDAVRQWRYRPYLMDGKAVEVDTVVTVNFLAR